MVIRWVGYFFRISSIIVFCFISIELCAQDDTMDSFVAELMGKMTIEEKIGQLNLINQGIVTGLKTNEDAALKIERGEVGGIFGLRTPEVLYENQKIAVEKSRLHIPLFFGLDVIHGHKTIFPIPLALSCSWDMELIKKSAEIAASEASADGLNLVFSPMVDITRDPRWGRVAEGSGEDPYLGSLIAKAMVEAYQGNSLSEKNTVGACVKHFALYGAVEAGREYNSVDMSTMRMYEYYFPPYKAAVDAGVVSVMSAFNDVNGIPSAANRWLLTEVLRNHWGFNGLVVSDYSSISELTNHGLGNPKIAACLALKAGNDMDMASEEYLSNLKDLLKEGKITEQEIDESCKRVLELKYKLGLFEDPYRYLDTERSRTEMLTSENRTAALETAKRSFVLLKNSNQTLPLKKSGTIAVVGPLAKNKRNLLGTWVMAGDTNNMVSIVEGIRKEAGSNAKILYAKGANITDDDYLLNRLNYSSQNVEIDKRSPELMLKEAIEIANKSDVIVAVLGESFNMSGEAASRSDIEIPDSQKKLFKTMIRTGKPVVLVLVNGRPLTLVDEDTYASAILETFAGGTEAGDAIAEVLFGKYNPSGKLSITYPRSIAQIPIYYSHKNTGRPYINSENPENKSNYLDISNEPLYPFGYGLSYTTFTYTDIELSNNKLKGNDTLLASVTITNTGNFVGEETVQLYLTDPVASISRSVKDLKGFKKVVLHPGDKKVVSFLITPENLKFFNQDLRYDWESGEFIIHIGTNSKDVISTSFIWDK